MEAAEIEGHGVQRAGSQVNQVPGPGVLSLTGVGEQHTMGPRTQVKDSHAVRRPIDRRDREQHAVSARQVLRPQMVPLAIAGIWTRQHFDPATIGGNTLQTGFGIVGPKMTYPSSPHVTPRL